jgi:hypothetical protein
MFYSHFRPHPRLVRVARTCSVTDGVILRFRKRSRSYTVAGCALVLLLLVAVGGCGKEGGKIPVNGIVKLDGRPLANASVSFIAETPGCRDAYGLTNADGVFYLTTAKVGDGVPPGRYKVIVKPVAAPEPGVVHKSVQEAMKAAARKPRRPAIVLPPRYSESSKTVLVQDVPPTGNVVFDLQSK